MAMIFLGLLPFLGIALIIIIIAAVAAAKQNERNDMSLKKAYLYLVSVISLIIAVVGAIMLINLALKAWVFTKADQNYYAMTCPVAPDGKTANCDNAQLAEQAKNQQTSQRQNSAAQAIAMIIVATPVWYYHWRLARREA